MIAQICGSIDQTCDAGDISAACQPIDDSVECSLHQLVSFGINSREPDYRWLDMGCVQDHGSDDDIPF